MLRNTLFSLFTALMLIPAMARSMTEHTHVKPEPEEQKFRQALQDLQKHVQDAISEVPAKLIYNLVWNNAYRSTTAHVRYTSNDDIPSQEKDFNEQRAIATRRGLTKFLNKPVAHPPRIALAFSGGGMRATIATLGFLKAAQETGLLDSAHYMAGLSGSTWAIAPWLASGKKLNDFLSELSVRLKGGIQPLSPSKELIKVVIATFIAKFLYGQTVTAMDIYGALLARLLLASNDDPTGGIDLTFSEAHAESTSGKVPLPLYTAVETTVKPYEWMEVSPFELGSSYLKSYIPVWSFGRTFDNARSITIKLGFAPEQTLGYFMAVFGSAFEMNLKDIIEHSSDVIDMLMDQLPEALDQYLGSSKFYRMSYEALKAVLPSVLKQFFEDLSTYLNQAASEWSDTRLLPDMQPNYTYNMDTSPLKNDKALTMIDAGFAFNLPVPPLLRPAREVDIMILFDVSDVTGSRGAVALKQAEEYARTHGYKFPTIDYTRAGKELVSVFSDPEDPSTPSVIYLPLINNPAYTYAHCDETGMCSAKEFDVEACIKSGPCAITNFDYTVEEAGRLAGLAGFTLAQHAAIIKDAIEEKAAYREAH